MNEHQEHLPKCGTCVWFREEHPAIEGQDYRSGRCWRYPPSTAATGRIHHRPSVHDEAFCGERLAVKT